jgi:hypothetical protein
LSAKTLTIIHPTEEALRLRLVHAARIHDKVERMNAHGRGWAIVAVATGLWLASSGIAASQDLSIDLEAEGGLNALFRGLDILASIAGSVDLVGSLSSEDLVTDFSSSGRASGVGIHHVLLLLSKGWILWAAKGVTALQCPIDIRCLLYVPPHPLISIQAGDSIEGVHYLAIQSDGAVETYEGTWTGTVVGGLAAPEVAGTIRLTGNIHIHLQGHKSSDALPLDFPENIPLEDPDIGEEFLDDVAAAFDFSNPWAAHEEQDQP